MPGYERQNVRRLEAYTPGAQPESELAVKLNTNENPYPPPQAVVDAISSVRSDQLRRYPPPLAQPLRARAAEMHGVEADQVIATNGGDELLRLAVTVFTEPSPARFTGAGSEEPRLGGLGLAQPSYSLYPVLAAIHDTPVTYVPLDSDFALPTDFADQLNEAGCPLAFLVNPHAPSGRFQPIDQLRQIAERFAGVLLIDEAYVDFADNDALSLVRRQTALDNVLILRTMSKGYSLAGLRCGYGLGHPDLIAALDKARDSYNTDILTQTAGLAALEHREEAARSWEAVKGERNRLSGALRQREFTVLPSESNFILVTPPAQGPSAEQVHSDLTRNHIYVRYFDQDRLRDKLRITIGTPGQNSKLLEAIDQWLT